MKILCLKYFQHISRIIQIMQPAIQTDSKTCKSGIRIQNRSNLQPDQLLEQELESLKMNIQNLLKYCQKLESQNKSLKRNISCPNEILQKNFYVIGQNEFSKQNFIQSSDLLRNSSTEKMLEQIQKQNEELRKTRQLYLGSLNKIHKLKNEIQDLTQKLNSMKQSYEKFQTDDSDSSEHQDMFSTQQSLLPFAEKKSSDNCPNEDFDLQHLLCHEDLSVDEPPMKENCFLKSNEYQNQYESLITKGIQFREAKALRSHEFKYLDTIISKYRTESMRNPRPLIMQKAKSLLYR